MKYISTKKKSHLIHEARDNPNSLDHYSKPSDSAFHQNVINHND